MGSFTTNAEHQTIARPHNAVESKTLKVNNFSSWVFRGIQAERVKASIFPGEENEEATIERARTELKLKVGEIRGGD